MHRKRPNGKYPPEFKRLVVETMWEEDLGYLETERKFHLSKMRAKHWETTYMYYGPEGFSSERRGRRSKDGKEEQPMEIKYKPPESNKRKKIRKKDIQAEGQGAAGSAALPAQPLKESN